MESLRLQWYNHNQKHKIEIRGTENGPILIGRLDEYHITLNYPTVSRPHAEIFARNNVWYIRNLSSSNPIHIGSRQLGTQEKTKLYDRMSFGIGPISFKAALKEAEPEIPKLKCWNCKKIDEYKPEGFCSGCGMALHGAKTVFA